MSDNPAMLIDLSQLDPKTLEEKGVWRDQTGDIVTRVGILLSIYFVDGSLPQKRSGMLAILDEYLHLFATKVTRYQQEDERRLRKWDGNGIPEVYRENALVNDKGSFAVFMLGEDSVKTDDPGLFHFMGFCHDRHAVWLPLSVIKCHFPPTWFYQNADAFVDRVRRWCGLVGCLHGSCGLGALSNSGSELQTGPSHYFLLKRYPGLEYDAVGSYLSNSAERPNQGYRRPRSSNWLTMLGDENLDRLGGRAAVRDRLRNEMTLLEYDGGALIRAGQLPQWGDGRTGELPAPYKAAAAIVKPIRFEDYGYGFMKVPSPLDYTAESLAWLRRFD